MIHPNKEEAKDFQPTQGLRSKHHEYKRKKGVPLKKGQLIRLDYMDGVFRVAEDVKWNKDFNSWGSVWLESLYPPRFTHKGGIKIVPQNKGE